MKNHILLLLIVSLFISNCSERKHSTPIITFNDTAYIKIIAENDFDSLVISTQSYSIFPPMSLDKKKVINGKGIYKLAYKISKPEMVTITIIDTFDTYIRPSDTLVIKVGADSIEVKGSSVYYRIEDPIYEFLKDEKKTFGNSYFDSPIRNQAFGTIPATQSDYQEIVQRINTAQLERLAFIDKYQHKLPNWFVNTHKNDVIYFSAGLKFYQYYYLHNKNYFENKTINEPPPVDVEINNPDALLSTYYYLFLQSYFLMSCKIDNNRTGNSRSMALYNSSSKYINSMLKNDVLKYFNMYYLFHINIFCQSKSDYDSVSQFMKIHDFGFNESELSFVNNERSKKQKEIDQKSKLHNGEKATIFALKDITGKLNLLSEFKNKIVYLHFWATWCKPCIKEIPAINQLYERIGDNPVVIVNICIDYQTEKWKQILKKENLKGINLICQGKWADILSKGYSIAALPHYSLVDKNGFLIEYSCERPTVIYSELMKYLNNK
jgi:thiol-disulfide isomerase/thioredoxin